MVIPYFLIAKPQIFSVKPIFSKVKPPYLILKPSFSWLNQVKPQVSIVQPALFTKIFGW
jgi:hypothetical protein